MVTRDMIVDLPHEYQGNSILIDTKHEEDALCWLWAFPDLFPWSKPISWLYTPVVGNDRWPGDLWGIDSEGQLLVIEAKHCKRNDDPFFDFVYFHKPDRLEFSSAHWRQKWADHLSAELAFPDGFSPRPVGKTGGILPRSNKRSHLRCWQTLCIGIDQQIRSPNYQESVIQNLNARLQSQEPTPYYFALMIQTDTRHRILSDTARLSARSLQAIAGALHVGVVAINCTRISEVQGRLHAYSTAF